MIPSHFRRVRRALVLACAFELATGGCGQSPSPNSPTSATAEKAASANPAASNTLAATDDAPLLTEVTEQLGFKRPREPWPDGTYMTPEITPGGIALFDYDNDGRLDILQICHGPPGKFDTPVPNRLFHQQPDGTFKEMPNAGGLVSGGYAHGVAVGDVENRGVPDVFIS
ncbi:MAG TPA: VCBS repeat-containing protein, partial [Pirellulales bacterium]|nr:VCBS repeat-containing protein [Pirellulales bacterium]